MKKIHLTSEQIQVMKKNGHLTNRQFRYLQEAGHRINIKVTRAYVGIMPVVHICYYEIKDFKKAAIILNSLAMALPSNHTFLVG